jgi:hypothetical protein
MRIILFAFCTLILLSATGCFFPGGRDHEHDRSRYLNDNDHPGVDHGEHPGDLDHHENR